MTDILELKDLVGYLPYNLKMLSTQGTIEELVAVIGEKSKYSGDISTYYNGKIGRASCRERVLRLV